jgi:hypothetical protein
MRKLLIFFIIVIASSSFANLLSPPIFNGQQMVEIERSIFADPSFTPQERQELRQMYARATLRIKAFYGEQRAKRIDVIFCKSDSCKTYFSGYDKRPRAFPTGGQAPGATFRTLAPTIVTAQRTSGEENIIAHELSHIEFIERLGNYRTPSWFNEGVAALIENDSACSRVTERGVDDITRLKDGKTWTDYTNTYKISIQTYCQAAAEVNRWVRIYGKQALLTILDDVKAGKDFEKLYFKR